MSGTGAQEAVGGLLEISWPRWSRRLVGGFGTLAAMVSSFIASPADAQAVPNLGQLPPARSEEVLFAILDLGGREKKAADVCWAWGCVVIINHTTDYLIEDFRVDTNAVGSAEPKWSPNQFDTPLKPSKAFLIYKGGDASMCDVAARFLLKHRKTDKRVTIDERISLCKTPHVHSILRVKVLEPQVIWDDEEPDK